MIKIYFDRMHSCTLTITNGEFFYDFVDDLNEDGRNIVVDTCECMASILRFVDAFNELETNQFAVRLDSSSCSKQLFVSGIREYLCGLMIMLANVPRFDVTMNYFSGIGSEVEVTCLRRLIYKS